MAQRTATSFHDVHELLARSDELFERARLDLQKGDLSAEKIADLRARLEELNARTQHFIEEIQKQHASRTEANQK